MFQSELWDRSLLNTNSNRRLETPFRNNGDVQTVMNVLKGLPDVRTISSPSSTTTTTTTSTVTTSSAIISVTAGSSTAATALKLPPSPSKAHGFIPSSSKALMASSSGFRITRCQSEQATTTNLNVSPKSLSGRKRRVSVPSSSNSIVSNSGNTIGCTASASLSSLLSTHDLQLPKHSGSSNSQRKKSAVDTTSTPGSRLHFSNGVNTPSLNSHQLSGSNLAKTVTFSLRNQQNVNLVRLTPVSLRSKIEQSPSVGSPATNEEEIENLKDLVLLHLELVQQQQSIIAEKDKLISELRSETQRLKTRLDRMDRRLTKKKVSPKTEKSTTSTLLLVGSKQTRNITEDSVASVTSKQIKSRPAPETPAVDKPETLPDEKRIKKDTQKQNRKPKQRKTQARKSSESIIADNKADPEPVDNNDQSEGIFLVEEDYFTQQVHEMEEPVDETYPRGNDAKFIEVPSFRVHTYTNCYNLEGTEDVDDQVFYKRHQKHESDEKKRKRWDLQRQREQQMREKLKQSQCTATPKPATALSRDKQLDSIFPQASTVQYIEICEKLPVNVFGHPLPNIQPSEFQLPWYDSSQTPKTGKNAKKVKR